MASNHNSFSIVVELIYDGEHYKTLMSRSYFQDLGISKPDVDLEVGSGFYAQQTAEIMRCIEPVTLNAQPDAVLVVGDGNSTRLLLPLSHPKIVYPPSNSHGLPSRSLIAHVEAG
ncbi:MAG: UDP-N-acetylglucosamine 2-epimerase [Nitrospirales bacterium]|nr:UDP-N-acetylglucosamine 2-epimerase [Nitrospirales bacterium]